MSVEQSKNGELVTTTIHLVRHGHVYNPKEILYGRLPRFTLSEEGFKQARAVADVLADKPIAAVYSSPMLRARKTGGVILERFPGLKLKISTLLNEVHTPYDGQPLVELEKINWQFYEDVRPPYETPEDIVGRVRKFFRRVHREYKGRHVIAVSHGDILCFARVWARQMPINGQSKRQVVHIDETGYPATGSITSFTFENDDPDTLPTYTYRVPY
jgi:broad specificity phosphatase PhoE